MNAAYHDPPAPSVSPHFDSGQLRLDSKWSFSEGIVTAWLLFVLALAWFILGIFATVKQSRWWLVIVLRSSH